MLVKRGELSEAERVLKDLGGFELDDAREASYLEAQYRLLATWIAEGRARGADRDEDRTRYWRAAKRLAESIGDAGPVPEGLLVEGLMHAGLAKVHLGMVEAGRQEIRYAIRRASEIARPKTSLGCSLALAESYEHDDVREARQHLEHARDRASSCESAFLGRWAETLARRIDSQGLDLDQPMDEALQEFRRIYLRNADRRAVVSGRKPWELMEISERTYYRMKGRTEPD